LLAVAAVLFPGFARADVIYVVNSAAGTVGAYTTTGQVINPALITGLVSPYAVAVSGSNLFVSSFGNGIGTTGRISEYTTSGAVANANLITGLSEPTGVTVSGTDLYVVDLGSRTVGKYTTSGAPINPSLISLPTNVPQDVIVSGSNLFVLGQHLAEYTTSGAVVNPSLTPNLGTPFGFVIVGSNVFIVSPGGAPGTGKVLEFTTSGQPVNLNFITGLSDPHSIAVSGGHFFISSFFPSSTISEYTMSGVLVNGDLVPGLNRPYGIAIAPDSGVPLASGAWQGVIAIVCMALFFRCWNVRRWLQSEPVPAT
jgi:hypothetical protein